MEDNVRLVTANIDRAEMTIPAFGSQSAIILEITKIREGETRLPEAEIVNPGTYSNLEYVFNEGYREGKRHLSVIGYQITLAEKAMRLAKSVALLDHYNDFLKEKKLKDSAQIRDAFLEQQPDYTAAQDRLDMLKAMDALIEGKVKNFENVCRYMKKSMDLIIRSGMDTNKYTQR